jgi:hypothetical protein
MNRNKRQQRLNGGSTMLKQGRGAKPIMGILIQWISGLKEE